jgi:hypothetical protein
MTVYWRIIANELAEEGWLLGWTRIVSQQGSRMWQVDARCGDGRLFVSRAEILTSAFLELELMIRRQ